MKLNYNIELNTDKIEDAMSHMIGFPGNLAYKYDDVVDTFKFYLNNIGDPYKNSQFKSNTKDLEVKVLKFFKELWDIKDEKAWGYLTYSGTEGNMQGLYMAREVFPKGILYFSKESHYSILKIAKLLRIEYKIINVLENGEMSYVDLLKKIDRTKPVIICANLGTTVLCAHDDVTKIHDGITELGIKDLYIHVDGALNGFIFPFLKENFFFNKYVNSLSISGHKFLGIPFPCGVFLMEQTFVDKITQHIEYINCNDNTISGSRNGHTAIFMDYIISKKGHRGFQRDIYECMNNAHYLIKELKKIGIEAWKNVYATTVIFPRMNEKITDKWQLSSRGDISHVVVLPHVTKKVIDKFLNDVKNLK